MFKNLILFLTFFVISNSMILCQEEQNLLSAPDDWKSERLDFPLSFAPSIDLVGFEDLRFAPDWSDSTGQNFWTYKFVWFTEKEFQLTESSLSASLESYFNGLMGVNTKGEKSANGPNKTLCIFIKTDEGFRGRVRVHDAFFTKKEMTLHVKVKDLVCPKSKKQYVLFELSTKDFDHVTWKIFEDVKLVTECK